jgi:tripartite-type tricarboxylate transporter receptor subunit TctC
MKSMGGFSAIHVPYKGSAPAMADLLAGSVSLLFDSIPSSLPQVRAGKLRGIAVASSRRSPVLPELPTLAEAGSPDLPQTAGSASWRPPAHRAK